MTWGSTAEEAMSNLALVCIATFAFRRTEGDEDDYLARTGLKVQTMGVDAKSIKPVLQSTDRPREYRLFIDATKPPTNSETQAALKNLS